MIFFLTFVLLLISQNVSSADTVRAIQTSEGVAVMSSEQNLDEAWESHPLKGNPFIDIDRSKLPDSSDRKYWKILGSNVVVDVVKKQNDLDKRTAVEAEKTAVLAKLKISKKEAEALQEI